MSENNGAGPASAAKLMVMSSQSKIAACLRDVNPMLDQCICKDDMVYLFNLYSFRLYSASLFLHTPRDQDFV